jgi:hypothetical protein
MDAWVRDYDDAKQLADDTLALIQARLPAAPGTTHWVEVR